RAHRIGQDHPVEVVTLQTTGTVEQNISKLLTVKEELASTMLEQNLPTTEDEDRNLTDNLSGLSETELQTLIGGTTTTGTTTTGTGASTASTVAATAMTGIIPTAIQQDVIEQDVIEQEEEVWL